MPPMSSPLGAVLAALVDAIRADAGVAALVGARVYAVRAAKDAVVPYVTIGEPTEAGWHAFNHPGAAGSLRLHIWTEPDRLDRVALVYGALHARLDRRPLALAGGYVMGDAFVTLEGAANDADGRTMHGVARYEHNTRQA